MDVKDRIRYFRKDIIQMTQDEFRKEIHISRSNLASIETGGVNVTDRLISTICDKFKISEHWLRTGDGDMYVQTENSLINQLKREYNLDERRAAAIESFLDLNPEMQDALLDGIFALADNIKSRTADRAAERNTAHQLLDQEMDAEEKAASASLTTGSAAEDKRA